MIPAEIIQDGRFCGNITFEHVFFSMISLSLPHRCVGQHANDSSHLKADLAS